MTHLSDFGTLGWSWILEQALFFFEVSLTENDRVYVKLTSCWVWKKTVEYIESYDEKRENLPKFVKMSHFARLILEKPKIFLQFFLT